MPTDPTLVPLPGALVLRGVRFAPPLFNAPMAGLTHSAFRRLLADFGGYGALFTEMLSAKAILGESPARSPWLRRRPQEGAVIYQLLAATPDRLEAVVARLAPLTPDAIDLNAACPAPVIRQQRGGSELFDDIDRLRAVVRVLRRCVSVPFTVKIRLGYRAPDWRSRLTERLRVLAGEGVDAITLHPRFSEENLSRTPRCALYAEVAAETGLPLIANGDITGPDSWSALASRFGPVSGLMVGRMAAIRPWVFAQWTNPHLTVDYREVWMRLFNYILDDFPRTGQALARVKIFTSYYARNFAFGHTLFSAVQSAPDLETARARADAFLSNSPTLVRTPSMDGL